MIAGLTQEKLEIVPFADLESRRELWSELAARSGNIFASWEWASVWWRHFAAGADPAFAECRLGERPFAILPLYTAKRGPLRMQRLIGHGPGDVLGPVCAPEDAELAGHALRRALAELPARRRLLLAERLPTGALGTALGGRVLQREACPELTIEGREWDEFLASCSRNLREKLRRNRRKLERDHELGFRLCADPARLDADFETLQRLHAARWEEGESSFQREATLAFHREFAAAALQAGWLRLWTLEVDGAAAAAWYGFRFGGTESFYQSGRDRRFDRFSIGFLMLMRTIEAAFEDGMTRYSFLRGDEPYKDRLASADAGLETRALGRGPFGRAIVGGASLALRSERLRKLAAGAVR
jgi:CelD/BcsL family acetyltransferase involved in cellulose biosynthesis